MSERTPGVPAGAKLGTVKLNIGPKYFTGEYSAVVTLEPDNQYGKFLHEVEIPKQFERLGDEYRRAEKNEWYLGDIGTAYLAPARTTGEYIILRRKAVKRKRLVIEWEKYSTAYSFAVAAENAEEFAANMNRTCPGVCTVEEYEAQP